jgi:hypothetical protein
MHLDNSCSLCRAIMHNPKYSTHVTTGIKLYLIFVLVFNKSEHIILQSFTCFFCKTPVLFSLSLKNMCTIIYWMGYINLYNVLGRVAVHKLYFNNCTRLSNKVQINYVLYQNSRCIFYQHLIQFLFYSISKMFSLSFHWIWNVTWLHIPQYTSFNSSIILSFHWIWNITWLYIPQYTLPWVVLDIHINWHECFAQYF